MSQMRRTRRFRARFCASRSEIRSPVYSAIFFPRLKGLVAKQPLPLMVDLRMARPGASFITPIVVGVNSQYHPRQRMGQELNLPLWSHLLTQTVLTSSACSVIRLWRYVTHKL